MPATLRLAPGHRTLARPLADQVDRVDPRADVTFLALTESLIRLAKIDAAHRCSPSCNAGECRPRRVSARRFLSALRTGTAQPWASWVAVAAERAGRSPGLSGLTWLAQ
jgi:hypothetical protein